jgi:DNA polymerase V
MLHDRKQVHLGPPLQVARMGRCLCAGFPSPADDYLEDPLDPARLIVTNPISTFIWRVSGHSMIGRGIQDGDGNPAHKHRPIRAT